MNNPIFNFLEKQIHPVCMYGINSAGNVFQKLSWCSYSTGCYCIFFGLFVYFIHCNKNFKMGIRRKKQRFGIDWDNNVDKYFVIVIRESKKLSYGLY